MAPVVAAAVACRSYPQASEELLATLTTCPIGVEEQITGHFTWECVRELFRNEIKLAEPPDGYSNWSFRISTPAEPTQLKVVFGSNDRDEDKTIHLNIDPPHVLPLYLPTDEVMVGKLEVEVARRDEGRRTQFSWHDAGWNYSLDAPTENSSQLDAALEMIRTAR
jgi:hypothetical protein